MILKALNKLNKNNDIGYSHKDKDIETVIHYNISCMKNDKHSNSNSPRIIIEKETGYILIIAKRRIEEIGPK